MDDIKSTFDSKRSNQLLKAGHYLAAVVRSVMLLPQKLQKLPENDSLCGRHSKWKGRGKMGAIEHTGHAREGRARK